MRSTQVAKNIMTGFVGQLITMILGFATRTVFIYVLSEAYLGVSGLFTSILTVLNLTELGIGVSITYALYRPIANSDYETIKALMHFYKQAYRLIGLSILIIGIVALPFLEYLVTGATDLANIRIVFIMYIAETVTSYWLNAYKRTLLEANQQKYVVTLFNSATSLFQAIMRIGLLLVLHKQPQKAFYAYTFIGILGQILNNLLLGWRADKEFPYLTDKNVTKLTKEQRKPIFKNVFGVFVSKISGIMLGAADNILISAFISIVITGVYSYYTTIIAYIVKPIGLVFDSITASVGDYCARESLEKQERFFKTVQFTYFWIYGFCAISLWILMDPFIELVWHGHVLSKFAVFLIVTNFLLDGLAGAVIKFRVAHGLYWQAKFRYIFSALFNAVISFLLIKPMGVAGVLLGSTMSIIIMLSFDPIIVFKNVFHKSALPYYLSYLGYLALVLITGISVTLLLVPFSETSIRNFLIKLTACMLLPNFTWLLIFRKSEHIEYLRDYVITVWRIMKRIIKNKNGANQ